ncbi:unnamed protein product [Paramecium pentaurelia]|uniref:Uncharacterized protein n=1 Tax=Paramecium pentaurelia TaxID=43138 RepID=A0A8S1TH84_9CILI|nr:unnamed protein product [Paramecium pentaurelia]
MIPNSQYNCFYTILKRSYQYVNKCLRLALYYKMQQQQGVQHVHLIL